MNALIRWAVVAGLAFGGLAGGYHWHLQSHPHKVLVVLDTSYPMLAAWPRVAGLLRSLEGRRYTRYALETDKAPVHGYAAVFAPGHIEPYAPRNFARLAGRAGEPNFAEADEVILISNATPEELAALPAWRVVRP